MKQISDEMRQAIIREEHLKHSIRGGAATKEKYGTSYYKNIGAKGRAARKRNAKKIGKRVAKSK